MPTYQNLLTTELTNLLEKQIEKYNLKVSRGKSDEVQLAMYEHEIALIKKELVSRIKDIPNSVDQ